MGTVTGPPLSVPELAFERLANDWRGQATFGDSAEPWHDEQGRVYAISWVDDATGRFRVRWLDLAEFSVSGNSDVVVATAPPGVAASAVEEAYWGSVLPLVLQARGTQVLHASAVVISGGVVAFCAERGAGKSSLAVALGCLGQPMFADDALAWHVWQGQPCAFPLPFRPRLRPDALAALAPEMSRPAPRWPAQWHPLTVLCLLRRTSQLAGDRCLWAQRVAGGAAYDQLLRQAYCHVVGDSDTRRTLAQAYLDLADCVPIVELTVVDALERLPSVAAELRRVLDEASVVA